MALISLDNVSKIYPKGTRPALDDINLDIERGDFVFLVGASGSGKTTLLSLLTKVIQDRKLLIHEFCQDTVIGEEVKTIAFNTSIMNMLSLSKLRNKPCHECVDF